MAKLTVQDVMHVARLAHLDLEPQEAEAHVDSFNQILGYVEKLNAIDLNEVQATSQVFPQEHPGGTPQSPDQPQKGLLPEEVIQNAPDHQDTYFKIPRVLES